MFGTIERAVVTGARVKLVYDDEGIEYNDFAGDTWRDTQVLRPEAFADYRAFARRLVELRRAKKPVLVKIAPASE